MREISTSGIVLSHKPQNEYDRLVTLFTNSFGKILAIAKFAQKSTSPFVGRLDIGNICKLNLYRSAKGKFTIRQCVLLKNFENIRKEIMLYSFANGVLEIANKLTYQHQNMKKYFDLIQKTLETLEQNKKPHLIYLIFKIKFLYLLGIIPSFKHCMICHKKISLSDITVWGPENLVCVSCLEIFGKKIPGAVFDADMLKFLNYVADCDYEKSLKIKTNKKLIETLGIFIDEIWRNHNLAEINSEKIIRQIL